MRTVSVLLLFALLGCLSAQEMLRGVVRDNQGRPLSAAALDLGGGRSAWTGADGGFALELPAGDSATLHVYLLGFKPFSRVLFRPFPGHLDIVLEAEAFLLPRVEVSGTWAEEKAPVSRSEVGKEALDKLGLGQDMPYLLRLLPSSVITSDAGTGVGYTGIRIRGSDASRIHVAVNGIPLNDAESQNVYWVNLPDFAASVDRIQVQRGAGTSTNGPGAFGATIQLQSDAVRAEPYGRLETGLGSFSTFRNSASFGTGLISNHMVLEGRLSSIRSDGYIDRASADLRSWYLSGSWLARNFVLKAIAFDGHERTYQSWYGTPRSRVDGDLPGMMAYIDRNGLTEAQALNLLESGRTYNFYTYPEEVDDYRQQHYQLHLSARPASSFEIKLTGNYTRGGGYYEQYRSGDLFSRYGLPDPEIGDSVVSAADFIRRRWLDNDFYFASASARYEHQGFILQAGTSLGLYRGRHFGRLIWSSLGASLQPDQEYYRGRGDKEEPSAFAKLTWTRGDWTWFVDLQYRGIRYQTRGTDNDLRTYAVRRDLDFFNPKAGLRYTLAPGHSLYLSVARASREPSRDDLVDAPAGTNPRHEQMTDWEVGWERQGAAGSFGLNAYYMRYGDQLVLNGLLNDVGNPVRVNVAKSYRAGIEGSVGYAPARGWKVDANLTLSDNRIREFTQAVYDYESGELIQEEYRNTPISFSPAITANLLLSWDPLPWLGTDLILKHVGRQFLDNTGQTDAALDAYTTADLMLRVSPATKWCKRLQMQAGVMNLANTWYSSNGYTYAYQYGQRIREVFLYPQAGRHFLTRLLLEF